MEREWGVQNPARPAWHAWETLRIGLPLAAAQLAQMAMGVTDAALLGALGPAALAAGGLGGSVGISIVVVLQGVLGGVSILVAQARGAGRDAAVPGLYWTGMLLPLLLMAPTIALFGLTEDLLLLAGEPPRLAHDVGLFTGALRWCIPGALIGIGLLRAFLPAIDAGWIIFPVTLAATVVNGLLCFGLIHGRWGLPEMGVEGAAWATVVVNSLVALTLLLLTHTGRRWRPYVRWARPSLPLLGTILRLGIPIGGTFAVETGLFLAIAILIGFLGAPSLAAQQVALTSISVAFMIPLGIAQAANVRVGTRVGAGDPGGARLAGLVAIALGAGFECAFAIVNVVAPDWVVGLYLDRAETEAFQTATALLGVAAVFQVADGVQCVAAGALRGLGDTTVPFALATLGYWGIGFPLAWALTLRVDWGAAGAWWGLAAGLGAVAVLLTRRFDRSAARPWPARA